MSLADVLVLELYFGRKNATQMIEVLDPWCFSGETSKATIAFKGFSQSILDIAKDNGKQIAHFTKESKTAYLLSAFLTRERPALIRESRAKQTPSGRLESSVNLGILTAGFLPGKPVLAAIPGRDLCKYPLCLLFIFRSLRSDTPNANEHGAAAALPLAAG